MMALAIAFSASNGWGAQPRDVGDAAANSHSLDPVPADFDSLDIGWLRVQFPASVRDRAEAAAASAIHFRSVLRQDLGQPVLQKALVRVARDPGQMRLLAPQGSPPPAYAVGVAYPSAHLVLVSLKAPGSWEASDLAEVLRHELTHLALYDATGGQPVPLWFNEGLAVRESGELRWQRIRDLWNGALSNRLLSLEEMNRRFPGDPTGVGVAYAESADVVRFLMRDADRARFGSLIERVRAGTAFKRALLDAYGLDTRTLEYEWREHLRRHLGLLPTLAGGGLLWVLMAGLVGAAWVGKRRRAAVKLGEWAREEADAAMVTSSQAVLAERTGHPAAEEPPPRMASIPVVEHEGRWHTLH